ncbi:MAG: hypothetical protein BroJett014_31280 [Planctomycetota bacterium]|nr:MAG: hypothetical protein BroJett014_31280 [Planctomycetota bacterium]
MASLNGFNANEVDPNVAFEPLPPGEYLAVVVASEMKPTKNGAGEYLQLELEVIDGPHKGRKVWDRLMLKHSNSQTVAIAKGTLSALCRAVGVLVPRDSSELHNLPVVVKVACKKRDDTGEPVNVIRGYSRKGVGDSQASVRAPAGVGPGTTPPWKR